MTTRELIRKILQHADLESDRDNPDRIHEAVIRDIVFRGTNLWILTFAIILASVGLNINSTAVIIGAMLISPLMGPINGMGYSIATYDFRLLRQSAKNLSFAVAAGLVASTAYFAITPLSEAHSELLARTSPTIYDVLIALFGGLAGTVAMSSKQKGNVIAGVAIATALMPPLCTAGYGLARAHFAYFFGAVYLFTINTVFIALSAVIMSRILRFPIRRGIDESRRKGIARAVTAIVIVVIIPSIFFGYNLVQKEKFLENAQRFVRTISVIRGNYLLSNAIDPGARTVTLVYGGTSLSDEDKESVRQRALDFSLDSAAVVVRQGFSFEDVNRRNSVEENLRGEIAKLSLLVGAKQARIDSIETLNDAGRDILREARALYPQVAACSCAGTYTYRDTGGSRESTTLVVITVKRGSLPRTAEVRLEHWLRAKLHNGPLEVYFHEVTKAGR